MRILQSSASGISTHIAPTRRASFTLDHGAIESFLLLTSVPYSSETNTLRIILLNARSDLNLIMTNHV
jgi:hypothetical protein